MAATHGEDGQLLINMATMEELGAKDERAAQEIQKKQADQEIQIEKARKMQIQEQVIRVQKENYNRFL